MTDFTEETPGNIEEIKKEARDKTNYNNRLNAVRRLGEFKCKQSIDILWSLLMQDKVYAVQEEAFRKLQAFGEKVKLPKKKKGHLVKDINKKLSKVNNTLTENFTMEIFTEKFREMYPIEFDIYSYEKSNNFEEWIQNVLNGLPKKK